MERGREEEYGKGEAGEKKGKMIKMEEGGRRRDGGGGEKRRESGRGENRRGEEEGMAEERRRRGRAKEGKIGGEGIVRQETLLKMASPFDNDDIVP